jgi:hypothetical protein
MKMGMLSAAAAEMRAYPWHYGCPFEIKLQKLKSSGNHLGNH